MINPPHHGCMLFFFAILALVLAGPLSLLLNERADFDERTRHRAWV